MNRMWTGAVMLIVAIIVIGGVAALLVSTPQPQPKNIVQVASEAGSFNTLLAAAEAAGLSETLSTEGPFTVFAPTDEAFSKLPAGTVESLLENPDALRQILLYHVVSGKVESGQVVQLDRVTTLQGGTLSVDTSNGVRIGNANVVAADVMASNGVIHVIDTVLIPS
jgi:uncharacterized surface protein with fasciclin (FAS1) repeats